MNMAMGETVISGAIDIFAVLLNAGIFILLIYLLAYRIPKALIKFAIEKYFQERRMDIVYRQGSQSTSSAPSYQISQQGEHHQE